MKRLGFYTAVLGLLAIVSWLTFALTIVRRCAREGLCVEGRTLAQWQRDLEPSSSPMRRRDAVKAISRFGPRAVPSLIGALTDPHPGIRSDAAAALGSIGPAAAQAVPALIKVWQEPDDFTHQTPVHAAEALGRIGPAAREAVPALVEVVRAGPRGSNKPQAALNALRSMGPVAGDAVPALVEVLDGPQRAWAARTLMAIDPESESTRTAVTAAWVRILNDNSQDCCQPYYDQRSAAEYLAQLGPGGLPPLAQALADRHNHVRSTIVQQMGMFGPAALPALTTVIADPDTGVRLYVPSALQQIGPPAVPLLVRALGDEDSGMRMNAALALGRIGPAAAEAVPALLTQGLRDPWPGARHQAIEALERIGPAARRAAPDLRRLAAQDADPVVRRLAADALRKIGAD